MMASLFAGVSGLKNHQVRMNVVGDNIANVNTIGYKVGRATFQEALVQTMKNVVKLYRRDPGAWQNIMRRGMIQDFSWNKMKNQYSQFLKPAKYPAFSIDDQK